MSLLEYNIRSIKLDDLDYFEQVWWFFFIPSNLRTDSSVFVKYVIWVLKRPSSCLALITFSKDATILSRGLTGTDSLTQ